MVIKIFIWLLLVQFCASVTSNYIRGCYYSNWVFYQQNKNKYLPENNYISGLCTHMFYDFGSIGSDFTLSISQSNDLLSAKNAFKQKQPGIFSLLNIGNNLDNESFGLFKNLISNAQNRQKFVNSVFDFIQKNNFDGISLNLQFPDANDQQNFVLLLQDLRQSLGNNKILTITGSPDKEIIDAGYGVLQISKLVDFVNVLNIDSEISQEVASSSEPFAISMNYWNIKGMPKNKLILGISSFAQEWIIESGNANGLNALDPVGKQYVPSDNFAAYYEICSMENQKQQISMNDRFWYGYDDVESVATKMEWIKKNGFGGAYIWDITSDDYNGICPGAQKYPLLTAINMGLQGTSNSQPPKKQECKTFQLCWFKKNAKMLLLVARKIKPSSPGSRRTNVYGSPRFPNQRPNTLTSLKQKVKNIFSPSTNRNAITQKPPLSFTAPKSNIGFQEKVKNFFTSSSSQKITVHNPQTLANNGGGIKQKITNFFSPSTSNQVVTQRPPLRITTTKSNIGFQQKVKNVFSSPSSSSIRNTFFSTKTKITNKIKNTFG